MTDLAEELREEYTIETPESVSFRYDVAGIGSRFIGALIDLTAVALLLTVLNFVTWVLVIALGGVDLLLAGLEADAGWLPGLIIGLNALIEFGIIWGYFILFELLWDGQSPGKWAVGTRVVRLDGEPAGFSEAAIRNLVRFVDFLPAAYAIGFVTMLFNDKSRRLGDFAAGTLVVRERSALRLADLSATPASTAASTAAPTPASTAASMPASTAASTPASTAASTPASIAASTNTAPQAPTEVPAAPESRDDSLAPNAYLRRLNHDDYLLIRDALDREAAGRLPISTLDRLALLYARRLETPSPARGRENTRAFLAALAQGWEEKNSR